MPRAAAPRRCEASQRRLAPGFLKLFRNPALCAVTTVVFWGYGDRGETVLEASPEQARPTTPAAAVGSHGIFRASAAGSLGLARLRQPAPALHRIRDMPLSPRSAGPSAGGGGTEHAPLRPGVARHHSRFRRDRGCVTSFSIQAHSAGPT